MAEKSTDLRRSLAGVLLVAVAVVALLRLAGPARLVAVLALAAGAFYLNRADPKRLAAILVVIAFGLAWAAYRAWQR